MGGQEKRNDRKTKRCRSEEKVDGFSSASLFPARKREVVTQGGNNGDKPPDAASSNDFQ